MQCTYPLLPFQCLLRPRHRACLLCGFFFSFLGRSTRMPLFTTWGALSPANGMASTPPTSPSQHTDFSLLLYSLALSPLVNVIKKSSSRQTMPPAAQSVPRRCSSHLPAYTRPARHNFHLRLRQPLRCMVALPTCMCFRTEECGLLYAHVYVACHRGALPLGKSGDTRSLEAALHAVYNRRIGQPDWRPLLCMFFCN